MPDGVSRFIKRKLEERREAKERREVELAPFRKIEEETRTVELAELRKQQAIERGKARARIEVAPRPSFAQQFVRGFSAQPSAQDQEFATLRQQAYQAELRRQQIKQAARLQVRQQVGVVTARKVPSLIPAAPMPAASFVGDVLGFGLAQPSQPQQQFITRRIRVGKGRKKQFKTRMVALPQAAQPEPRRSMMDLL